MLNHKVLPIINIRKIKKYRKPLLAFGIFILILIIGFFGVSYFLRNKIIETLDSREGLKFESVEVPWNCQSILVRGLSFTGDSIQQHFDGSKCSSIRISGLGWWSFIKDREIVIDEIKIDDGLVNFRQVDKQTESKPKSEIPPIKVKKVRFNELDVSVDLSESKVFKSTRLHGQISNINYNVADSSQATFQLNNLYAVNSSYQDKTGAYKLEWDSIYYNEQHVLWVNNLQLVPKYTKEEWSGQFKYRKARLSFNVPEIKVYQPSFDTLLYEQKLLADSVIINDPNLEVFIEKEKLPCPDCVKTFVYQKFYESNFPINIKQVLVRQTQIEIEVKSNKTDESGAILFYDTYASIYDVNNYFQHTIKADVKSYFMKQSLLQLALEFDLHRGNFAYRLEGSLEEFDFKDLSTFFYLTRRARIKSGIGDKMQWSFSGNQEVAEGELTMDYKDLEVTLFEKKGGEAKNILSGIINDLGINNTNLPGDEKYRKGIIYYEHPKNQGMFHQWWQALLSGIKSIILPKILLDDELKSD